MATYNLATRTADFLIQHPPYSFVPHEELRTIAKPFSLRLVGEGETVFEQGQAFGGEVFVLQKGQIEIFQHQEGIEELLDYCEEGDTFGVRAALTKHNYLATARAAKESLVYVIPDKLFDELSTRYPRVGLFFAAGFAAGMAIVREEHKTMMHNQREMLSGSPSQMLLKEEELVPVKRQHEVPFCTTHNTALEAAQIMVEYRESAIVVIDGKLHPAGIVTNKDFTRNIASGKYILATHVSEIMSSPVRTIKADSTIAEVLLQMMRYNIRHLVVTEDGSADSKLVGMITERDVLLSQGNNPAILVKQILRARTVEKMAMIRERAEELVQHYLSHELSIPFVSSLITEINDALIQRAVEMSLEKLGPASVSFVWLSLGSEGRKEQLLRTDQDNALLYADPLSEEREETQAYFVQLGESVTRILESCGFAHCPGEIMASNPKWCQPLSGWKAHFDEWILKKDPKALMHGTIFFDFRATYGDDHLAHELMAHLAGQIQQHDAFLPFFAQNALKNPPPLSFFRRFMVERNGEHKDEFDIKSRAMMPLADAARVLILQNNIAHIQNTKERYEKLAELEPQNAPLYLEAAMAYDLLLRKRALNGLTNRDSGRYLDPGKLNKIEKKTLRSTFQTIKSLQSLLRTRFSLNFLGS